MQKQFLPEEEPPSSSPEESDPRLFRFFAADPRTPLLAVFLGLYSPSDGSKSLLWSSSSLELPSDSLSVNSDGLTRSSNLGFFLGAGFFLGGAFLAGAFFLGGVEAIPHLNFPLLILRLLPPPRSRFSFSFLLELLSLWVLVSVWPSAWAKKNIIMKWIKNLEIFTFF